MKDRINERIEMLNQDEKAKKALLDLSVTGAAFLLPAEEKKGTRISVKIKEYALEAVVVYCSERSDGFRVGIQFQGIPDHVQKALKVMVDEFSRGVPLSCEVMEPKNENPKNN
jgi:hypothetical protein